MKNSKYAILALAVGAAVLLTACGGGGGPSTAPTTPTQTAPTTTSSSINSVVATPNYPVASQQAVVYSLLNAARVSCGFGSVSQSTQLDQAALAHAKWLMVNHYAPGHYETSGTPGYTGNGPQDRGAAAGYAYAYTFAYSGEIVTEYLATAYSGAKLVSNLLSAPYHMVGAMQGFANVGIGYIDDATAGTTVQYGPETTLNIDFGVPAGSLNQEPSTSDVLTYPCQGTTGTAWELQGETPNPVPGRNLQTSPIGQPILVYAAHGQTIVLTSATMTNVASGANVTLLAPVYSGNDPNAELQNNEGFIMPNAPLSPNTSYQVTVNGTNNGTAFSRTFTFTTGS